MIALQAESFLFALLQFSVRGYSTPSKKKKPVMALVHLFFVQCFMY